MRVEEIRELYAYNRWANARFREAALMLSAEQFTRDLKSSFPSVRDTLVHILSAEWIWLSRWRGVSPRAMPEEWRASTFDELAKYWAEVEADQTEFMEALAEERLDEVIAYTNTRGEAHAYPLAQLLRHVVNHSTYHRGQVTTMLRQVGVPAPSTDLVLFYGSTVPR